MDYSPDYFDNFVIAISPELKLSKIVSRIAPEINLIDIDDKDIDQNVDLLKKTRYFVVEPTVYEKVKDKIPSALWIQSTFAGVDKFINEGINENIILTKFGGQFGFEMSEYIISQIVYYERNYRYADHLQKNHIWDNSKFLVYRSLRTLKIGIIGFGIIGKEVAKTCKTFGMEIWAMKKTVSTEKMPYVDKIFYNDGLIEILQSCDYICNILPSTKETVGIYNNLLHHCAKKQSIFINIGRGNSISSDYLITALNNKWIGGAILDVFSEEPLSSDSELWSMPNVVITPHVAAVPQFEDVAKLFVENYRLLKSELPLKLEINKSFGY